ncbi:uncharacterized protein LOC125254270 [Megalobrama amblycephala]|uniref:uncharacterized protein LOC125254270 n=1 Tax=Megalobrama amblycephala TaxID=75352 RepID=UPI002014440D|nr:uncharacterized protein LOC125254270 [Megalobrama amblycephala]
MPEPCSMGSSGGGGTGSSDSPAQPSASEAARDMDSSSGSSSDPPNETRSLACAEGRCSGWENLTGDCSLVGEGEARGGWADVSSLNSGRWVALPRCLFLAGSRREGDGRARAAGLLPAKKATRERREARLMHSQCGHEASVSAASAWGLPRHPTHSSCPSLSCRGALQYRTARKTLSEGAPDGGRRRLRRWPEQEAGGGRLEDGARGSSPRGRRRCRSPAAQLGPLRGLFNGGESCFFQAAS